MTKQNIIDTIIDFLGSDAAGDAKGVYHPEIVKQHLSNVFNQVIYNTWISGKKSSDFSQLDAWSKTYEVAVVSQVGAKAHGFLPFAPVQLPNGMGIRQVADNADTSTVFAPMESTADVVFAELDVNTMDSTSTYKLEQNNLNTDEGESSHMLKFGKLPEAPSTTIASVDVLMVQNIEQTGDYDIIVMPQGSEDSLVKQVIDLMSKKQESDTSNDGVFNPQN